MKVFEVEIHGDGLRVKAPGVSEIEIKKEFMYFAADSIDAVWHHVKQQYLHDGEELKTVRTVIESVGILDSRVNREPQIPESE